MAGESGIDRSNVGARKCGFDAHIVHSGKRDQTVIEHPGQNYIPVMVDALFKQRLSY